MRRRDAEDKHADQKIQAVGLPGIGGAVLRHGPYGQCRGLYIGAAGRVGDGPCGSGGLGPLVPGTPYPCRFGGRCGHRVWGYRRLGISGPFVRPPAPSGQGRGNRPLRQAGAGVRGRYQHPRIDYGEAFFEKRGYRVIREQQVERQGVALTNFVMEKRR